MPTRTFYYNKFIVDGVQHEHLPGNFTNVNDPTWSVRSNTYPTLDLKNVVVIEQANSDDRYPYNGKRKVQRQAWVAEFSSDSFMSFDMYDHLRELFTIQKSFWLQYDDEMSRDAARLETMGNDFQSYYTPTFPIAPYGYGPTHVVDYNGTVWVNNVPKFSGFSIDSELGVVKFSTALNISSEVLMAYTWRSFVRIMAFDMRPMSQVAQTGYTGTVVFEQMRPNHAYDPWRTGYSKHYNMDASGNLFYQDSLVYSWNASAPSNASQLWNDTRYDTDYASNPIVSYVESGNTGCGSAGDISCLTQNTLSGSLLI